MSADFLLRDWLLISQHHFVIPYKTRLSQKFLFLLYYRIDTELLIFIKKRPINELHEQF
jgi:hypothetical protein